jgi:DNA ligase D-like protein (predicted polymerase)
VADIEPSDSEPSSSAEPPTAESSAARRPPRGRTTAQRSTTPRPPRIPKSEQTPPVVLEVAGRQVSVSNPDKVFFPKIGLTKLQLVEYYLAVGEGALRGVYLRPTVMKRFPNGAEADFFFQKRVPDSRPDWLETVTVAFPSGRTATELCPTDVAHLAWAANLGCIDLNPWPVRRFDVDHPDELRIDLDPQPGVTWATVRRVAHAVNELLLELGMVGHPKTSGSRGIHINVRIVARHTFDEIRRSALAIARELERRMPGDVTSAWWKAERPVAVFVDYNQNARDRTVASVYSVRPTPNAQVSAPFRWDELDDLELADFTVATVPERYRTLGDIGAAIDDTHYRLDAALELVARDATRGLDDGAWPPHFRNQRGQRRSGQPPAPESDD